MEDAAPAVAHQGVDPTMCLNPTHVRATPATVGVAVMDVDHQDPAAPAVDQDHVDPLSPQDPTASAPAAGQDHAVDPQAQDHPISAEDQAANHPPQL